MFTRATCENGTWNWKLLSFTNHLPYCCAHGSETCESRTIPLGFDIGSVQFSCSVIKLTLCTPWTAVSPRLCWNSCPLSWWCHPTTSTSVASSSWPQSFPASRSFSMSWLFASDGQSTDTSASVLSKNIQGWFPLGLTGLISLLYKWLSRILSNTTVWKHWFFSAQPSLWSNYQSIHD